MTHRRFPGWVFPVVALITATAGWFLWTNLGPVSTTSDQLRVVQRELRAEQRARQIDHQSDQAQIDSLKAALIQANADRAARGEAPIVVMPAPTTTPTTVAPTTTTLAPTPTTTSCRVPLPSGGCVLR